MSRTTPKVAVETARSLAGPWTAAPSLRWRFDADGIAPGHGQAGFDWIAGMVQKVGQVALRTPFPEGLSGRLVRVLVAGSATWHGIFSDDTLAPRLDPGGSGVVEINANHIGSVLDQMAVNDCAVRNGASYRLPGFCPAFNGTAGGEMGPTQTVSGASIHVWDPAADTKWTAGAIVGHLLAIIPRQGFPGSPPAGVGWEWTLDDPLGCLDWQPERIDPQGQTLHQILMQLIPQERGLAWWVEVSGGACVIHVVSGVRDAITYQGQTLPANPDQTPFDPIGNKFIEGVRLRRATAAIADLIEIVGRQPWTAATLCIGGDLPTLIPGWDNDQETLWRNLPNSSGLRYVFRRFLLADYWKGGTWTATGEPSDGIRQTLGADAAGYDGSRTFEPLAPSIPPAVLELTSDLPCAPGFQSVLRSGQRQRATVFTELESGAWVARPTWTVSVERYPAAVVIDDGNNGVDICGVLMDDVENTIYSGLRILVTIGVREPDPLRVSWVRGASSWPCENPRRVRLTTESEQWRLPAGLVTGIALDDSASLVVRATDLTIQDETIPMRRQLAHAIGWYGSDTCTAEWNDRGIYDTAPDFRPGTLVTTLNRGDSLIDLDALVTRRTRRLVRLGRTCRIDTAYATDIYYPSLRALT